MTKRENILKDLRDGLSNKEVAYKWNVTRQYVSHVLQPNLSYHRAYKSARRVRDRLAVIDALGGKCVKCGFSDYRALQIDHVNGGGCADTRGQCKVKYYKRVIADKTGMYQLLCANCNWIKRAENGEASGPKIKISREGELAADLRRQINIPWWQNVNARLGVVDVKFSKN